MELIIVETPKDIFVSDFNKDSCWRNDLSLFLFDGKMPKTSFKAKWYRIDKIPQKIEEKVSQPPINRW